MQQSTLEYLYLVRGTQNDLFFDVVQCMNEVQDHFCVSFLISITHFAFLLRFTSSDWTQSLNYLFCSLRTLSFNTTNWASTKLLVLPHCYKLFSIRMTSTFFKLK